MGAGGFNDILTTALHGISPIRDLTGDWGDLGHIACIPFILVDGDWG
jgi:hypothetical protein